MQPGHGTASRPPPHPNIQEINGILWVKLGSSGGAPPQGGTQIKTRGGDAKDEQICAEMQ